MKFRLGLIRTMIVCCTVSVLLSGCSRESSDGEFPAGKYPLELRVAGLKVVTEETNRSIADNNWEGVSQMAVMVGGAVKRYSVVPSADNLTATIRSDDPFYWTSREDMVVSAWYPFAEIDGRPDTSMPAVVVKADQSTLSGYESSDYVSAEMQTVSFGDPTITFAHRTTKVTVRLETNDVVTDFTDARIRIVGLSADDGNPTSVIPYGGDVENQYRALIAPQTISAGTPFISIETGGNIYVYMPDTDIIFKAGYQYVYTISVIYSGLDVDATIDDWEIDPDNPGDEGQAVYLPYTYDAGTNTYRVYTAEGLLKWHDAALADLSTNCILEADIVLDLPADGSSNWTPVGVNSANPYSGTFDGNGCSISNLTVETPAESARGMFGYVNGGTIRNLSLRNASVCGKNNVGGLAGYCVDATIEACGYGGTVEGTESVGGLVGRLENSTVKACHVDGGTVTVTSAVGGLVGNISLNGSCSVVACVFRGEADGGGLSAGSKFLDFGYYNSGCTFAANYVEQLGGEGAQVHEKASPATVVIDGVTNMWPEAVEAMNAALGDGFGWRYAMDESGTVPVLVRR